MIKTTINKITLLLLFSLCLGCSSTLYAAQNDELDDEKDNLGPNGPDAQQNDPNNQGSKPITASQNYQDLQKKGKEKSITVWSCSVCTLKNTIEDTKCVACKTPNPEWLRHKQKQPAKKKLSDHNPISVAFINYEAQLLVSYRFKVMFNNSACEMSHTYKSLYAAHKHIIKTYKVADKRLVFPAQLTLSNENILAYYFAQDNTHYANHGKKLQQYLSSLLSIYYKTKNEGILDVLGIWICDLCKIFNNKHINKKCIKCKSEQLTINVKRRYDSIFDSVYDYWYRFTISVAYSDDISLAYVLAKAIKYINQEEEGSGYIYFTKWIGGSSFVGKNIENKITSSDNLEWDAVVKQKITTWRKDEIIKKGLEVYIEDRYHHVPQATKITCPYIKDVHQAKYSGLDLALQCPIYRDAKKHYIVNEEVFKHLHFFSHFLDEYKGKAVCRYGAACKSFARLEENGNLVKDLSHIKLYRHPPRRNRQIQLNENIHQFICNQNEKDNKRLYKPTYREKNNLIRLLLDEVIDNGYKYDLCLTCKKNNKCTHDVYQKNKNSLISIIEDKFKHPRYAKMKKPFHESLYNPDALMLSLILYTGCDCNYSLCAAQRNGDYDRWKIFDFCLWHAIYCLSQKEHGTYKLYSGLSNIKIPVKNIRSGYFPTYTSTTLYKDIAKTFVGTQGMMIEIDQAVRNAFICCDVSWISKFGADESEVLIARTPKSDKHPVNNFFVQILDDKLGIQTVLLTKRPSYDLACKDIILKISAIIAGKESDDSKLPADSVISIFKQLIAGAKEVPYQASKRWNTFRHQQQRITINMEGMYSDYKAFIPLLFDTKCKNLLLLHKIAQLFPNVAEIICKNIDKVGYYERSADIVSSNFMLGVKECLGKIDKQAKLTKIVIRMDEHEIKNDCKLYATQFGTLGWKIGKGSRTIVVTKATYHVMCKDVLPKIKSMIQGNKLENDEATSLDVPIFKKLIADDKDIPADVQQSWKVLRYQQQRITIDLGYMYCCYKAFIPILVDQKIKNLLLLDKLAQLFPNVTEIICKNTDCVGGKHSLFSEWAGKYSSAIVCSNFILGVKDRLSKIDKHTKLTKILIQTDEHEIAADCKLYATQFTTLGWQIGKGSKTIGLTKTPYGDYISKISSMIQYSEEIYETTSLDVSIFNRLIAGGKDMPADVKKHWDVFRYQQQYITINMFYMYQYYKVFMPLLFDPKCKNLLLFDQIARIFPCVVKIVCEFTDYIGYDEGGKYIGNSSSVINSNFILGVKACLSKMDKHAKLEKIIIQTNKKAIKYNCKLYPTQFGALGWHIGKESKTILLKPYKVICKGAIAKIKSMLQGNKLENDEATSLDMFGFKKLIDEAKDGLADVRQIWNELRHQQQRITINMEDMYKYYKAFMPLLVDPKCKNLLLLDKLVQLFPNVTEIICAATDCVGGKYDKWGDFKEEYSTDIVCSNFILGVKGCLSKMPKHVKLTKIIIQTWKHEIRYNCKLYPTQFGELGWHIGKGNKTIALMKASYDFSKVSSMIQGASPSYGATPLDIPISIFKQLIADSKDVPADVQQRWDKLRHKQQCITINIEYMYQDYKSFMFLLFDVKCKNLLLFDKIAQLFPNVTEIICTNTDHGGYWDPSAIVSSNFILGLKERLHKMDKHTKLTKIVIQTERFIKDSCKLYAIQFGALGWQIGKGCDGKTILVTKVRYDVICKDVISKISSIIQAAAPSYHATILDVSIFNKLISGAKDIPADVQKKWHELKYQQQSIIIDMKYMHQYYKAFIPLLFDLKGKNMLLLDKIVQLFPNVTEIICKEMDYVGKDSKEYNPNILGYSSSLVCSNFILSLKEGLSKIPKHAKLTKTLLQTSQYGDEIKDDCNLYPTQFGALGWKMQRESYVVHPWGYELKNHQITLTRQQEPKPSFPNGLPAQADTNEQKLNDHQSADDEVFDID